MPTSPKTLTVPDQTLYFVQCDYGRIGKAFVETDPDKNSRLQVIADIFTGQIERPVQILECNPVEGTCRDVTEDIARDLSAHIQDAGEACPARLRDFLDLCLGAGAADRLDISTGNFCVGRTVARLIAAAE